MDVAWLAGLLEGEGWFGHTKRGAGPTSRFDYYVPVIAVAMNDEDVVRRVGCLINCAVHGPHLKQGGRRPTFRTAVHGHKAEALMEMLLPFLGERRSARVREVLDAGVIRKESVARSDEAPTVY